MERRFVIVKLDNYSDPQIEVNIRVQQYLDEGFTIDQCSIEAGCFVAVLEKRDEIAEHTSHIAKRVREELRRQGINTN